VVYVSCDIATLARDARRLVEAGYALTRVSGFDLFPDTAHIETLAAFDR
jgi:23S rRNA (uracil1939-C5)-methyltransferase